MTISPQLLDVDRETSTPSGPNTTPTVAVVYTRPETVLDDIAHAMDLAGVASALPTGVETLLKINISWQHYYPACSTSPWQLDGAIRALKSAGYGHLTPIHNGTVVVDPREGAVNNKHESVTERHGLESVYLEDAKWVDFEPKSPLLVLDKVYPDGFKIPQTLIGKNVVHLPTVKTHVFTTITGAMKNAFGGLLNYQRHWTHSVIHETLVDLLRIQKEIHPGIFAVTDGTFAGDGPGPRAMRWHAKNVILASADQVAIDAVSAKLMGFDPMSIDFIRLAHEHGLGTGMIEWDRSRGRRHRGGQLALPSSRKHLREPWTEAHLLGSAQAPGEHAAEIPDNSLGLRGIQCLPQQLLAAVHRQKAGARGDEDRLGPPIPVLLRPNS